MWRRGFPTVVLAAVLLGGCSEDVVVRYGPAPVPSGSPAFVMPDDGRLRPQDWPRACDLLTEADIRAILPSTTRVSSNSADTKFLGTGSSVPYSFTVPGARCGHQVFFPGTSASSHGASISIEVRFAGSPEAARHNWDEIVAEPGDTECAADFPGLGADVCARDDLQNFNVRKKGVIVQIGSQAPTLAEGSRLAGQTEEGAATSAWDADRVWEAEVTPLFVPPVLARLP